MPVLVNTIEKSRAGNSKHKNIIKSRNKTVKILGKLKNHNLPNSKSKNLSKFKNSIKVQNTGVIRELNFLTLNTRVALIKLR